MAPLENLKGEHTTKNSPSPEPAQCGSTAGRDETKNLQGEFSKENVRLAEASRWNQMQTQIRIPP